jgi:hypothetical protein
MDRYGIYNQNDDEMIAPLNQNQVWEYVKDNAPSYHNVSFQTDGEIVVMYEDSAPANGVHGRLTVREFFETFEGDGIIIRTLRGGSVDG